MEMKIFLSDEAFSSRIALATWRENNEVWRKKVI